MSVDKVFTYRRDLCKNIKYQPALVNSVMMHVEEQEGGTARAHKPVFELVIMGQHVLTWFNLLVYCESDKA